MIVVEREQTKKMWLVVPMFLAASQRERSFLRPQGMTLGKLVFDPQAQTIHQAHAAAIKQRGQPPTVHFVNPAPRMSGGVRGRGREASSYPDRAPQGGAYGIDNM
jgi:hypothetical protein